VSLALGRTDVQRRSIEGRRLNPQQKEAREARRRRTAELHALSSDELCKRMSESPGDSSLRIPFVIALLREGKQTRALSELGQIIEARGRDVRMARHFRVGLLMKLRRYEEAIDDMEHLIGSGDKCPENFYSLGSLYAKRGDLRLARIHWRRAIETSRDEGRRPKRWGLRSCMVWLIDRTLYNVRLRARFQLLWSYLKPYSRDGSAHP
jgi:tetratricopeptide (TPR) repeat protein